MVTAFEIICFLLVARAAFSTPISDSSHAVSHAARDDSASFSASSGPSWAENGAPFQSLDGGILFFFQEDGNIVVHQKDSDTVYWASGSTGQTCGNGRCKLQFQTDGNLVAVDYGVNPPKPFWSSGTQAYPGHPTAASQLIFRNTAPWIQLISSSGFTEWETSGTSESILVSNDEQAVVDSTWGAYWQERNDPFLALGDVLFFVQGDGNIVVHQQGTDTVYWASGSVGQNCNSQCHLQFQNDGNLVYVNYATNPPTPFWSTGTQSYSGHPEPATRLVFKRTAPYIQLLDKWGDNEWKTVGTNSFSKGSDDPPPFHDPGSAPKYPGPDPCFTHSCYECFGECGPAAPFQPIGGPGGDGDCTSSFRHRFARRMLAWTAPFFSEDTNVKLSRRFDNC